ncbi:uncharacterized protein LOC34622305, partial [Cyclospora cayetanensis]|uniref:Uncharacterized protein LOC34622305 n=1 Tax=Cyclospora cayetanensis TaxID=88456 RepID=A0A6P6RR26_9EIME
AAATTTASSNGSSRSTSVSKNQLSVSRAVRHQASKLKRMTANFLGRSLASASVNSEGGEKASSAMLWRQPLDCGVVVGEDALTTEVPFETEEGHRAAQPFLAWSRSLEWLDRRSSAEAGVITLLSHASPLKTPVLMGTDAQCNTIVAAAAANGGDQGPCPYIAPLEEIIRQLSPLIPPPAGLGMSLEEKTLAANTGVEAGDYGAPASHEAADADEAASAAQLEGADTGALDETADGGAEDRAEAGTAVDASNALVVEAAAKAAAAAGVADADARAAAVVSGRSGEVYAERFAAETSHWELSAEELEDEGTGTREPVETAAEGVEEAETMISAAAESEPQLWDVGGPWQGEAFSAEDTGTNTAAEEGSPAAGEAFVAAIPSRQEHSPVLEGEPALGEYLAATTAAADFAAEPCLEASEVFARNGEVAPARGVPLIPIPVEIGEATASDSDDLQGGLLTTSSRQLTSRGSEEDPEALDAKHLRLGLSDFPEWLMQVDADADEERRNPYKAVRLRKTGLLPCRGDAKHDEATACRIKARMEWMKNCAAKGRHQGRLSSGDADATSGPQERLSQASSRSVSRASESAWRERQQQQQQPNKGRLTSGQAAHRQIESRARGMSDAVKQQAQTSGTGKTTGGVLLSAAYGMHGTAAGAEPCVGSIPEDGVNKVAALRAKFERNSSTWFEGELHRFSRPGSLRDISSESH